jgi:prevent-host-death family protein
MSSGSAGVLDRPDLRGSAEEARIYTMRDLNQRTAEVMKDVEDHGPVFITRHGRFIAVIHPLGEGVERRVLAEMAREISEQTRSE